MGDHLEEAGIDEIRQWKVAKLDRALANFVSSHRRHHHTRLETYMSSSYLQGPAWIRGMLRAPGRLPLQSRTTIHRSESQNSCYDLSRNDNSATSE